jgi:hypothetical protein
MGGVTGAGGGASTIESVNAETGDGTETAGAGGVGAASGAGVTGGVRGAGGAGATSAGPGNAPESTSN